MSVKVSVVIPAYNVEKYIKFSVESILNQSLSEIEIICIDDGSSDNTLPILEEYALNDNRISVIKHNENLGASRSRNDGCRIANGKYIYFFDADDVLERCALEGLYCYAEDKALDVLSFDGTCFSEECLGDFVNEKEYIRKGKYEGVMTGAELFAKYVESGDHYGNLVFQFINRKFFDNNNLYQNDDLRGYDDSPFRMYLAAKRAMCIPERYYKRRYRKDSIMTSGNTIIKLESLMLAVYLDFMAWENSTLAEDINNTIERYFNYRYDQLKKTCSDCLMMESEYAILKKYPTVKWFFENFVVERNRYKGLTEEVVDNLRCYSDVILYGAGNVAFGVAEFLEKSGLPDYLVVVTSVNHIETFRNKPILSVDDDTIPWEKSAVIVSVSNRYADEVSNIVKNKGAKTIIYLN